MSSSRSQDRNFFLTAYVLVVLLVGCTPGSASKVGGQSNLKSFRTLTENALSVAHPDYGFYPGPSSENTSAGLSTTLTVYPIGTIVTAETGSTTVTASLDENSNTISVSSLPKTRLGRVLEALGSAKGAANSAQKLLVEMGQSVEVTAVVEFVEPMTEVAIQRTRPVLPQPQRALLAAGRGKSPLGNSLYCGKTCDSESYVLPFREWVSTLRVQDGPRLKSFGLDINALKEAAQEGKIYGLIYERYDPKTLLKVLESPIVKRLYIADVSLKCASDEATLCEPMSQ